MINTKMIDMAKTPEEIKEQFSSSVPCNINRYPYGLSIRLSNEELTKLGLSAEECEVGDMIHIMGMGEVTSISKNDSAEGPKHNIEVQITHLGIEDENEEEEEYRPDPSGYKNMYNEGE